MPLIIPVDQLACRERGQDPPDTNRDENQTDLDVVEPVFVPECGRSSSRYRIKTSKVQSGCHQNDQRRRIKQNPQGRQGVRKSESIILPQLGLFGGVKHKSPFGSALVPDHVRQRRIEWRRRNGPVSHDLATRFREEQEQRDRKDSREDEQEPEQPMPLQILTDQSADDGTQRWPEETPERRKGDVGAALLRRDCVPDQSVGQRNRATAPGTLQASQPEKRGVAILQAQSEVGADVDGEAQHVRRPSAHVVGEAGNHHGRQSLQYQIRRDREIDLRVRNVQRLCDRPQRREVYRTRQWRKESSQRTRKDDDPLLIRAEDGVRFLLRGVSA
ncbi:uncharacterized protein PV06_05576 [Exophiala oligosperma]|uniref:Uncharacterized protein n=1 Tax=Exophiala oligosperma TaxID=215243 RepID=A0A0D2BWY3_9EURO|nr:uncharacterized protein PV06_05576 [Exophiala oligosperma]KIW41982.1 hypothetical protein PV06_05576 [Exophiala oligosperma]